jgi:hypothetical protein
MAGTSRMGDSGKRLAGTVVAMTSAATASALAAPRAQHWALERSPVGHAWLVGRGHAEERHLTTQVLLALCEALVEAHWIEPALRDELADDRLALVLNPFLAQFGAVTLPMRPLDQRFYIGPEGVIVGADGRFRTPQQVLAANGWYVVPDETSRGPLYGVSARSEAATLYVSFPELIIELAALRSAMLATVKFNAGESESAQRHAEGALEALGIASESTSNYHSRSAHYLLGRAIVKRLQNGLLETVYEWDENAERARPRSIASTVAQHVWLVLGGTLGIIDVVDELPGIYECAYPRCGRRFARPTLRSRGQHTFCSDPCRRKHHATESRKRRAAGEPNSG